MQGHWQNMEVKWNHHSPWWLIKYSSFPSFWSPHDCDFSRVIGLFEVVQSLSPVQLFHDSMDCSPSGSSVHGILQARILEWLAISRPTDWTHLAGRWIRVQMTIKKCVSKRCGWTLWLPLADGGSWLISRYIAICRGLRGTEPALSISPGRVPLCNPSSHILLKGGDLWAKGHPTQISGWDVLKLATTEYCIDIKLCWRVSPAWDRCLYVP